MMASGAWKMAGALVFALLLAGPASASPTCSCIGVSASKAFEQSELVFVGTVIDRLEPPPRYQEYNGDTIAVVSGGDMVRWRLEPSEGWKGDAAEVIAVHSPRFGAACGTGFEIGRRYLVYAGLSSGDFWPAWPEGTVFPVWTTYLCNRTGPLEYAAADLEFLGEPLWTMPLPRVTALRQNRPNPFNPETRIELELPQSARAVLQIYDGNGRRVRRLLDRDLPAGVHGVSWDGQDDSGQTLASGVYFYELRAGAIVAGRRMVLLR